MTTRLHAAVREIPGVTITRPVRANAIFAVMDAAAIARVQERFFFYFFNGIRPEARWMTHWATTESDVDAFADAIRAAIPVSP
jgi:threonine aldolase